MRRRCHVWLLPLVAVCVPLLFATTAHAECAWIMWFSSEATGQRVWTPMSGYSSAAECTKALEHQR